MDKATMEKVQKCKTCKLIEEMGEIQKFSKEWHGKRPYVTTLKIILATVAYKENKRCGRSLYGTRPLNYCPECGKKIERKQTVWTD